MRHSLGAVLISFLLLGGFAASASGSVVFDGSPGITAPPATLGPYTMTPFSPDARPLDDQVSTVPGPLGNVTFSQPTAHNRVGVNWIGWSHGYTGDVYSTGPFPAPFTVTITPPPGTGAFAFYTQPNAGATAYPMTAVSGSASSGPVMVLGGTTGFATYFGFYASPGESLPPISLTLGESLGGFAVGEFLTAATGPKASLTPASHDFGPQQSDAGRSAPAQFTVTNDGGTSLAINEVRLTGNDAGQFAVENACQAALAPGKDCPLTVYFDPDHNGPASAALTVDTDAGTRTATLTGNGTEPPAVQPTRAKLKVKVAPNHRSVKAGKVVKFRITVRNSNAAAAKRVRVCSRLSRGLGIAKLRGAKLVNGKACWTVKKLAPGATRKFSLRARAYRVPRARTATNRVVVKAGNAATKRARARVKLQPART